jgi:hypothetical protein
VRLFPVWQSLRNNSFGSSKCSDGQTLYQPKSCYQNGTWTRFPASESERAGFQADLA